MVFLCVFFFCLIRVLQLSLSLKKEVDLSMYVVWIMISLIFLLFPHFTTDCEKIVLTSEFNCSRHLIGQFLFCRDYFLSNCDWSFYKILKDIVGLNTIFM